MGDLRGSAFMLVTPPGWRSIEPTRDRGHADGGVISRILHRKKNMEITPPSA
jgi:hypothetical protein